MPYKAQHGAGIVAKYMYMLALVCALLIQPSNDKKQLTPYGCPVAATNAYGLQLGVPIHTPTINLSIAIIIAERLSARHLILLRGRLSRLYIYMYIYPSRCLGTRTCCLGTSSHTCTCSYVYESVDVQVCISCALHVILGLHCTDHGADLKR